MDRWDRETAAKVQAILKEQCAQRPARLDAPAMSGRGALARAPRVARGLHGQIEPRGWEGEALRVAEVSQERIKSLRHESKQAGAASLDMAVVGEEKKSWAAARLASLMPVDVQVRMPGVSADRVERMLPHVYVVEVIASLSHAYSASCMVQGSNTLRDLAEVAGITGVEEEEVLQGTPANGFLALYLRHVDRRARENAAKANARKGLIPSLIDPRFRTEVVQRTRDGSKAAQGRFESLGFLRDAVERVGKQNLPLIGGLEQLFPGQRGWD